MMMYLYLPRTGSSLARLLRSYWVEPGQFHITEIFSSEENTSCLLFLMKVIDTDRSGGHILKLHI